MKAKINRKNIIKLLDKILDHNYFRVVSISIIISFVVFNGFGYLRNKPFDNIHKKTEKTLSKIKINFEDSKDKLDKLNDQVLIHQVKSGENLEEILLNLGASKSDSEKILEATKIMTDPRSIFQGQKIKIYYKTIITYNKNSPDKKLIRESIISKVSLSPDSEMDMIVTRQKDGSYSYKKSKKELVKKVTKYSGKIRSSLFVDGVNLGISPRVMIEVINLYSFDVDFQRDLREGDKFEIMFEDYYDKEGNKIKNGNILYSSLLLKNREPLEAYLFKHNNISEYFDRKGQSVRKSLLKTPINGARISSGFGFRRHPILGYLKQHKGIDFAASTGTPILAAGSGVIEFMGRHGGYGNYVRIKHNPEFSTAYAHASRFASGLKKGSKVRQGQVVAYVGTTGRSTGPHLHYEILRKGTQVNPSKIKTTSGIKLQGAALSKFKVVMGEIERLRKNK